MTEVDFNWSDGDPEAFARKLAELESVLMDHLAEAMETATLLIESTAKELVPVDTGRLRSSIASEVQQIATNVIQGFVGSNVEYAAAVEFGTSSHTITGNPLAWDEGGETHFATSVDHPGTEAQPYLRPAIETHRGDVVDLLKQAVEDAIDEVA